MSHANETLHYHLPKYVGTDIINPLTDFNDANDVIDEALYNANQTAANAVEIAQSASGEVGSYDARITAAETLANTAITKADNTMDMIADEFDPLKEGGYQIGDSVIYNQKLFTFINPHTGAWDAGDVKQGTITEAVEDTISEGEEAIRQEVQDALAEIAGQTEKVTATQKMIAQPFDPNKEGGYVATSVVTYADKLYQFNSDHVGAWTGLDVTQIDVEGQILLISEKLEGNLISSVEESYRSTITGTNKEVLKELFDHVKEVWQNKADNVGDIIIDGIELDNVNTLMCAWSCYNIFDRGDSADGNFSYVGVNSHQLFSVFYKAADDTIAYGSVLIANTGNTNHDYTNEATSRHMTINYHYLYKI